MFKESIFYARQRDIHAFEEQSPKTRPIQLNIAKLLCAVLCAGSGWCSVAPLPIMLGVHISYPFFLCTSHIKLKTQVLGTNL